MHTNLTQPVCIYLQCWLLRNEVGVRRFLWKPRYLRISDPCHRWSESTDQPLILISSDQPRVNHWISATGLLRCWNSSSRSDRLVIWSNNSSSSRSDQFRVQFLVESWIDVGSVLPPLLLFPLTHVPLPLPDTWGRPDADYHYPAAEIEDDDDNEGIILIVDKGDSACDLAAFMEADLGVGGPVLKSVINDDDNSDGVDRRSCALFYAIHYLRHLSDFAHCTASVHHSLNALLQL